MYTQSQLSTAIPEAKSFYTLVVDTYPEVKHHVWIHKETGQSCNRSKNNLCNPQEDSLINPEAAEASTQRGLWIIRWLSGQSLNAFNTLWNIIFS